VEALDILGAAGIGLLAGFAGGLVGIGGGVLFVPALVVFVDLSQVEAEATSLLAIVPVALLGAYRQHGYGNLRIRDGLIVGALSPLGVIAGSLLADSLPQRTLELLFAAMQVYFALGLARQALGDEPPR
jgi:uncharacterized protein